MSAHLRKAWREELAGVMLAKTVGVAEEQLAADAPPSEVTFGQLADAIIAFARAQIAAFKAPRRVEFVASLPRTDTGKIKRGALRALANPEAAS